MATLFIGHVSEVILYEGWSKVRIDTFNNGQSGSDFDRVGISDKCIHGKATSDFHCIRISYEGSYGVTSIECFVYRMESCLTIATEDQDSRHL